MRTYFLASLLSICILSQAQNRPEGFGEFKINKTTIGIIDSLTKQFNSYSTINIHEFSRYKGNPNFPWFELVSDTDYSEDNKYLDVYCSYCLEAKTFYISSLIIGGITCTEVYLTFLKDTLIEVRIDGFDLENNKMSATLDQQSQFLETKYGKGLDILAYSQRYQKNIKVGEKWSNGSILLQCGTIYYYNFHIGEKDFRMSPFSLFIRDNSKFAALTMCSEKERKRDIAVHNSKLKEKSSKF